MSDKLIPEHIEAFGLVMRRMTKEDIPLFCEWRNHPEVRPYMLNPGFVTQGALRMWLKKINQTGEILPFIISLRDKPFYYFEFKNINYSNGEFSTGSIPLNPDSIGSGFIMRVYLISELFAFKLNLCNKIVRIQRDNLRSIKTAEKLGAVLVGQDADFLVYRSDGAIRRAKLAYVAKAFHCQNEFNAYFN